MKKSHRIYLSEEEAGYLGIDINPSGVYRLKQKDHIKILKRRAEGDNVNGLSTHAISALKRHYNIEYKDLKPTTPEDIYIKTETDTELSGYSNAAPETQEEAMRVCSAWDDDGKIMDIDQYCEHYGFPRDDIHSYKLVSHTGTPYYNIAFKEKFEKDVRDIDFESIIAKYITEEPKKFIVGHIPNANDFDVLTYSDLHIGMEPDIKGNALYPVTWSPDDIMRVCLDMVRETIKEQQSDKLVVDELGDFFDGLDGLTTRGGHKLPQKLTDEESWDLGFKFKITLAQHLAPYYDHIIFNNICNDNHSGKFSYFVNQAFKHFAEATLSNVEVHNRREFLSHYMLGEFIFIITHGKDEEHKKFGMSVKPKPDDLTAIDQYIKHYDLYKYGKRIIVKKGDSHQAVFDMAASDDFWYFNYPSAAPSSQWIQTNFKKGYRGFWNESFRGNKNYLAPYFY